MLNINNQAFVTLKIDDKELEYVNAKNLTIAEGNGVLAPTIKIELDDPKSTLAKARALAEGNKIELLITRSVKDTESKPRKYRIFGVTRENASYNSNMAIVGLLDAPLFFTASTREGKEGTSGTVIQSVAEKCGLTYVGPSNGRCTNDKQIWLDVAKTRAAFILDTTRHGWIDNKSCMGSVVTSYHELRYKNLVDEINTGEGKIKFLFTHSKYDEKGKINFIVKEARDKSAAGLGTTWMNYGSSRGSNHIEGVPKKVEALAVHSPGVALAINKEVMDMVKRVRFDYSPMDCTNTHKEYQNALYQNIKILALFSETMSLLVTDVTNIQLYDMLIYRQADADPTAKVRNEDKYLVIGKTVVIRGGIHYAERIQCVRMSLTMAGSAPCATSLTEGSAAGSSAESSSLVPESSVNSSASGFGLSMLEDTRDLSSSMSDIGALDKQFAAGLSNTRDLKQFLLDNIGKVKKLFADADSSDEDVLATIKNLADGVSMVDTQQSSVLAAAKSLNSAVTVAAGNLASKPKQVTSASGATGTANSATTVGPATEAAQKSAAPAIEAAKSANIEIATATDATTAAWKTWKAAQALVASMPSNTSEAAKRAAAIADAQRLYNVWAQTARTAADIENANKATLDAAAAATASVAAAQKADRATAEKNNASATLAKAAFSKPNGAVDSASKAMLAATEAKSGLVEVWSLVGSTPTKYMVSPEVAALTEKHTLANDRCKAVMAEGIKTANLVMGAVQQVAPPNPMPPGNSATMAAMSALITKPGVTSGQISQFLAATVSKQKSGSPDWLYYNNIANAWGKSWAYDNSVKPL